MLEKERWWKEHGSNRTGYILILQSWLRSLYRDPSSKDEMSVNYIVGAVSLALLSPMEHLLTKGKGQSTKACGRQMQHCGFGYGSLVLNNASHR
jgi:hypothetical protein